MKIEDSTTKEQSPTKKEKEESKQQEKASKASSNVTTPAKSPSIKDKIKSSKYPLKTLLMEFLKTDKELSDTFEIPIKLTIQETFPLLIVNDGYHFLSASFTEEAWKAQAEQVKEHNTKISDLKAFLIQIKKFKL